MSSETTIEEKMREVPSFERTEHGENAVWAERTIFGDAILREDAIRIAREYAEARARPLVDLLTEVGLLGRGQWAMDARVPLDWSERVTAALEAEAKHRGDAKQSAEGGR